VAIAYFVLFSIPLCAPGWRTLGAIAATLGPLSLLACSEAEGGMKGAPLIGPILALFVTVGAAGFLSGLGTRALVIVLRERHPPLPATFGIVVTGFVLWPVGISLSASRNEWLRRPPDAACL